MLTNQTLNELFDKRESERTPEEIETIVVLLREQRERWNAEQARGSRKIVTSKQIGAQPKKKKGGFTKNLEGLVL